MNEFDDISFKFAVILSWFIAPCFIVYSFYDPELSWLKYFGLIALVALIFYHVIRYKRLKMTP